jgi:hypothetical protein
MKLLLFSDLHTQDRMGSCGSCDFRPGSCALQKPLAGSTFRDYRGADTMLITQL